MRITHFFNDTSKNAQDMHYDAEHGKGDIYDAYNKPSQSKICAYHDILNEYLYNDTSMLGVPCKSILVPHKLGKLCDTMFIRYINGTLNVAGASSHFFSTVAIFEDVETNERYIIKETHCNTYMCKL